MGGTHRGIPNAVPKILQPVFWLLGLIFFTCFFGRVEAQIGFPELTGEVLDEQGTPVSGASVTITQTATNRTTRAVSGATGAYTVPNLLPGTYLVEVEAPGFRRVERPGITLGTGERIRLDVRLSVGPVGNFPVADSYNRRLERDVSSGDLPNVFVASAFYEIPFFKDRPGPLGKLLGGWELSGIVTLQSGLPLAISQATNFNAFAGFGTQRPNRVGNPSLPESRRSVGRYFDTAVFVVAPQFTIGTSSRNPVRGPAYRNLDLALIKRTLLTERLNLEFRAEAFNVTNTPPLGNPNVVLGTPGFGSITSAGDPRVVQFGVKVHF